MRYINMIFSAVKMPRGGIYKNYKPAVFNFENITGDLDECTSDFM